jgi:uncharacterized protein DUF5658
MRRLRLEIMAIIVFVEFLPMATLRAGQDQGSSSSPTEVRALAEANPGLSSRPEPVQSFLPMANAPASSGALAIKTQPLESKPKSVRRSPLLIGLYVTHAVLQGLDAQSTLRGLHSGSAREGNPLARPFASNPGALVGFKAGVTAGTIFGIDRLYRTHPRMAMITLGAINGGYVFLVQRNYRSFPAR